MTRYQLSLALADSDLVELIQQKDDPSLAELAFRELERRYLPRFRAEIWRRPLLARDPGIALQEMRLALLHAARRFRGKQGVKFSTYFRKDLHGAVAKALRHGPQSLFLDEPTDPIAPDALSEVDLQLMLQVLMQGLTEPEKMVLSALCEGNTVSEIASARGLAKSTVSETITRIRRKALLAGIAPSAS